MWENTTDGIVFLLATIALPLLAWRRRPRTRMAQVVLGLAWLTAALNLILLIGLALVLPRAYELGLEYGMPPLLAILLLLVLPLIWWRSGWLLVGRAGYTLFVVGTLGFIPLLWYWNVLP